MKRAALLRKTPVRTVAAVSANEKSTGIVQRYT